MGTVLFNSLTDLRHERSGLREEDTLVRGSDSLETYFELLDSVLSRLMRKMARETGRLMAEGLTPAMFMVLRLLAPGRATVSDISERLGVTMSAVTYLCDRLCASGLITRERDEADRRLVWLDLTAQGREKLAEMEAVRLSLARKYLGVLGDEDREHLLRCLEKLDAATGD